MPLELELHRFGVAFGDFIVLADVELSIDGTGPHFIVGPAGAGKSTLLRTLAGLNDAQPSLRTWGTAEWGGRSLGAGHHPPLVAQHARLLTATVRENLASGLKNRRNLTPAEQIEALRGHLQAFGVLDLVPDLNAPVIDQPIFCQRVLAIVRNLLAEPSLLLVDEPTEGLDDDEAEPILQLLARESERRALLIVSHRQAHAKRLGGHLMFLAGGRTIEQSRTRDFFESPTHPLSAHFVRTGGAPIPSPNAKPEHVDPSTEMAPLPPEARAAPSAAVGPRGFAWLVPGQLGGTPRPGIFLPLIRDLEALVRLEIDVLVTLEEEEVVDSTAVEGFGIDHWHFPVPDMGAPTVEDAAAFIGRVEGTVSDGHAVAYHCRAGLGRTGTMLAAHHVWRGLGPLEALDAARAVNPRWVQSAEQISFLQSFAQFIERRGERRAMGEASPAVLSL